METKSNVVHISEHQARDVKRTLQHLMKLADAGQLKSVMFCVKFDAWHHGCWIAGDYAREPVAALAPARRMQDLIDKLIDESEPAPVIDLRQSERTQ